jgi:undecaprenyl-diphosphatase
MLPIQAVVLGLVQGLTEFLPVSSTAHLVVAQNLLGLSEPPVELDIIMHLATALATVIVLWPVIKAVNFKQIKLVVLAMIPTGILGLWLNQWDTLIFGSVVFSAITLIINGFILLLPKFIQAKAAGLNNQNAVLVGTAQGLAVLPGISRSGFTIVSGLLLGLKPADAYNFSFLISIPAILAAQLINVKNLQVDGIGVTNYGLGFAAAFISGIFALFWLKKIVSRGKLDGFAYYCLILGILLLV